MRKVLIYGGRNFGGREHALLEIFLRNGWEVYCVPGNRAIQERSNYWMVTPNGEGVQGLINYCQQESIDFVVIGSEDPLVEGYADALRDAGIAVFGPGKQAAMATEGSKWACKKLLQEARIRTAFAEMFTRETLDDAIDHVRSYDVSPTHPLVVKADGLCAGKGVTVAKTLQEAEAAVRACLEHGKYGQAGRTILLEDYLQECPGLERSEFSAFAIVNGYDNFILTPCAMDYKQTKDDDQGPMGGGSGAVSHPYFVTQEIETEVREMVWRFMVVLGKHSIDFRGVLYFGLKLTAAGVAVVEINCRWGDPELECLAGLEVQGLDKAMYAAARGATLRGIEVQWRKDQRSLGVVLMDQGYPDSNRVQKGYPIYGLEEAARIPGVQILHMGTGRDNGQVLANGGRVLFIRSVMPSLLEASGAAYVAAECILAKTPRLRCRGDIGLFGCHDSEI